MARKVRIDTVEIDDFIAELDLVMQQLEMAKRQASRAKAFAVNGKIQMYGMYSWRVLVLRARSLRNSFEKSWPLILEARSKDV